MASNKSVVVLAPNGRRQTVKITPNTTILQILEEVCKKQGLSTDEYDLKHHNNVLDTTSIIRFSGLPNNAQLEMCAAQRIRRDSPVTLGIQLECGTRLTGNFTPSDNLWHVIEKLCPNEAKKAENLVMIYMRQEVYGPTALQNTTLRSLGLTSGRAMLRLVHRTPEELKTQANVSAPLPLKPTEEQIAVPYYRRMQTIESICPTSHAGHESNVDGDQHRQNEDKSQPTNDSNFVTDFLRKEKTKKCISPRRQSQEEPMDVDQTEKKNAKCKIQFKDDTIVDDFVFLGERNAMAFSLEMAHAVPHEDLPDDFFELTIQDARKLYHDLKKKREEVEESPLQTTAYRNLEQSKKVLRQIHQYKKSVIRVQFPDRSVLQGTFKPIENIEDVMKFVKQYLYDPTIKFYLYTTPPKLVLNPSQTLVESDCVPSAVVHFGIHHTVPENFKFLRHDLLEKFVSPSIASIAASKLVTKIPYQPEDESDNRERRNTCREPEEHRDAGVNVGASTSKAVPQSSQDGPKSKVPKWFKQ